MELEELAEPQPRGDQAAGLPDWEEGATDWTDAYEV